MLRCLYFFAMLSLLNGAAYAQRPAGQRPVGRPAAPRTPKAVRPAVTNPDTGQFLVLHGRDTVAREHFGWTASELHGALVLTNAAHGIQQYLAALAPNGTVPVIEITVRMAGDSGPTSGAIAQRARVIFKDDSAAVDALTDHGIETHLFATKRGAVPYLNLSFALLELASRRVRAQKSQPVEVPFFNLGGGETVVGKFTAVGTDSLAFTIGDIEYRLHVDAKGRLLGARIPKQDVTVVRQ